MTQLIEDYALIGNNATAALVGRNGSIDWLSFPRFDSAACFAGMLGSHENGHWTIQPKAERPGVQRRYRQGTLVLETEFTTPEGTVVLVDCMDRRGEHQDVLRLVRGVSGRVQMRMELAIRFEYGAVIPWVSRLSDSTLSAVAGPDRIIFNAPIPVRGEDLKTRAEFVVGEGQEIPFALTWSSSFSAQPPELDVAAAVANVTKAWEKWSSRYKQEGPYAEAVLRSLITLKALTHHRTGGIVAAPTTSLPEEIGGARNWDYRFCWLRDSTFTLYALMEAGFIDEAKAWRDWLLRAVAGSPDQMQIMYGVAGERRLTEFELSELPGYEGSQPVRIGNAASEQLQLDVYGEVLDAFYQARRRGMPRLEVAWYLERALVSHIERIWSKPDDGIWEIRGKRRHFVHSKVMAWVAVDRAVRTMQEFGEEGPLERWIRLRADIHDEVCRFGFSQDIGSFVQYFGGKDLDASLLMLPLVGFLPPEDPRMRGTVAAIEKHLMPDGFVARYDTRSAVDGVPGNEGVFLACSFWLVDNYVLQHRYDEARALFERLLSIRNDVGLLSEEYDPRERRQLGNFPQAFSHLALVNSAHNLSADTKPARHRAARKTPVKHDHTLTTPLASVEK
ncbi:MAG: glycoside hydrolase family 15 protein [Acidobacteriaceae bacterium]|nr:glycoside hydrolase family 15 protein [Acidobacteriaceae bacterium]MBV9778705.1 glycoside hydrolase family 15 protein [Acidobacteriaceae bacterium]